MRIAHPNMNARAENHKRLVSPKLEPSRKLNGKLRLEKTSSSRKAMAYPYFYDAIFHEDSNPYVSLFTVRDFKYVHLCLYPISQQHVQNMLHNAHTTHTAMDF